MTLTETGNNTGIFETSVVTGTEGFTGSDGAVDSSMTLTYGDTVTLIIGFEDATISLTAGDSWLPVETADFTLTDADANKDSGSADTLDIGDPYDRIPTITIGDPLTLGDNVKTTQSTTDGGNALTHEGVIIQSMTSDTAADAGDQYWYKTNWANTTDNSKRLNIIVDGVSSTNSIVQPEETSATKTWVNITTGIHPSQLVDLPGTTLISYDVTSLADQLAASDINVLMTHGTAAAGANATVTAAGNIICVVSLGNTAAGIFDLDDLTGGDDCAPDLAVGDYDSAAERVGVHGIEDVWGRSRSKQSGILCIQIYTSSQGIPSKQWYVYNWSMLW